MRDTFIAALLLLSQVLAVPVQLFIRRSPALVDFLKCDVPAPGLQPYEQQVFDMWCSYVTQP